MTDQALRRLAGVFLLIAALLIAAVLILILAGREAVYSGWGFRGFPSLLASPFLFTGAIILRRHARHGIGWVFLTLGLSSALQGLLYEYMLYSLILYPGSLPGGIQVAWLLEVYWVSIIFLVAMILVLFPSGALPSPKWRWYVVSSAGFMALVSIIMSVTPGKLESSYGGLENPYGWEALRPATEILVAMTGLVFLVLFGPPIIGLVGRFRRAQGIERQQYKWFVYAAVLMVLTGMLTGSSYIPILQYVFMLSILLLPVAIAVAVLRYRLFDIDIIIRRTLQYGLLSGMIVMLYNGGVVLLQVGVSALTGRTDSALVTVITTLAIAAFFNPLRVRVQEFIDRRFYRSRYDAERSLEHFAAAARAEVDIDRLTQELLGTVDETMKPERYSLWLADVTRMLVDES